MLEALWSLEFESNVQGFGSGVAVLETGRLLGGDAQYLYIGNYHMENGKVIAEVKVTHYAGTPHSIFGSLQEFTLRLQGTPSHDAFVMHGHVLENQKLNIGIRLTRRAELP